MANNPARALADGASIRAVVDFRHVVGRGIVFLSRRELQAAENPRAGVYLDNSRLAGADVADVAVLRRLRAHGHESAPRGGDNVLNAHGRTRC